MFNLNPINEKDAFAFAESELGGEWVMQPLLKWDNNSHMYLPYKRKTEKEGNVVLISWGTNRSF